MLLVGWLVLAVAYRTMADAAQQLLITLTLALHVLLFQMLASRSAAARQTGCAPRRCSALQETLCMHRSGCSSRCGWGC
jgi:hypothetical protein